MNVDHAWMSAPTFPPHPHAGFSAVSYIFPDSETGIDNRDSLGTHNLIRPGGLHWITAGSGVIHQENPAEEGKTVHSLQIFVALAPQERDVAPFPLSLEPQDIPVFQGKGVKVRVPLGRFGDLSSPLKPPTAVTMLDVSLQSGATLTVPIPAGETAFVMPIFGTVDVDGQSFDFESLKVPVFSAQPSPQTITLGTARDTAKAMIFAGRPFN
ncbi:pirin family protein [Gluconacetobacter sacchari]|uniref:Pirin family protein n=2 Tax=Gluconacetobacter sacchari TaxID=92759 RepID=A0A7W4NRW9_9PROT|nr:pirin family protein [Gluconacetobacter sacchari]MBB2160620.1 pirin family protein [Gluconacetobacter sacchari]